MLIFEGFEAVRYAEFSVDGTRPTGMWRWVWVWVLLLLATAAPLSAADRSSDHGTDPRCIVYLRTETRGDRAIAVWAEATVEAPPGRVFDVLTDIERYPEYLPRVLKSERRPGDRVFTELKAPWPLRNIWFITRVERLVKGSVRLFRWAMEKGNIRRNEGTWTVRPLARAKDSSRLRYEGVIELHNLLPPALLKFAEEQELPRIVQALRRRTLGDKNPICQQTIMHRL